MVTDCVNKQYVAAKKPIFSEKCEKFLKKKLRHAAEAAFP